MVLLFLLFSPYSFAPTWMPLELFVIGLFVSWQTHRSPSVLRLLSRSSRLKRQVENAAALAFHEESVAGTRGRTGLLIYVSALEDRVVLIPDSGLDALIPRGVWNSVPWGEGRNPDQPGDLDHFLAGLSKVGEVLADAVPASEDNPDEISNAPRIRS